MPVHADVCHRGHRFQGSAPGSKPGTRCQALENGEIKPSGFHRTLRRSVTVEMREHDFVGEERGPLERRRTVGMGAADQFMLTVGEFHQFSMTKLAHETAVITLWNQIF